MTRLERYIKIRDPGDIKAICSKIPYLKSISDSTIQIMYSDFSFDFFSRSWAPVMIDDYPIDSFKEWLEQEVTLSYEKLQSSADL